MYDLVGKFPNQVNDYPFPLFQQFVFAELMTFFDFFVTSLSIVNTLVELEGSNGLLMSWLLRFSYFCQYNVKTLGNKTISLRSWQ